MKVGVLGAGQLGRMLALAGYPLGFDFVFLDPAAEACAAPLGEHLHAPYSDEGALAQLCERCDVVTYEFENVPVAAADFVLQRRPLRPGRAALATGQDRLAEKKLFDRLGIPVPRYVPVGTRAALDLAVQAVGLPAMLKTRRLGYDGKGQALLRTPADLDPAWQRLGQQPLILEAFVPFEREVSMLGVRGLKGELAFYPLVENVHRDGILRTAIPRAGDPLAPQAQAHVEKLLAELEYVGVLAFEFFVSAGKLLANEIAPRVHNSGHWTIEGASCSQFENHLRAVSGLPLGAAQLRGPCAMVNFIGAAPGLETLAAVPGVHPHYYGKTPKPQRKVGHATVLAQAGAELNRRVDALVALAVAAENAAPA